jgi:hypothetical protein
MTIRVAAASDDDSTTNDSKFVATSGGRLRTLMMAVVPMVVISNVLLSRFFSVTEFGIPNGAWEDAPLTFVTNTLSEKEENAVTSQNSSTSGSRIQSHDQPAPDLELTSSIHNSTETPLAPAVDIPLNETISVGNSTAQPQTSIQVTRNVILNPPFAGNDTRKSSNTLIIGFSDNGYKEIAWNWYQELTKLGHTEHYVVAQDVYSAVYFQEKGMRHDYIHAFDIQKANYGNATRFTNFREEQCSDYDQKYGNLAKQAQLYRRSLFGSRWAYVLRQLQGGYNVLLTDVDNVFVRYKNLTELEMEPFDSMHAFAGTIDAFPRNVFRAKGFTICGGMSWLRSAPGVMEIAEKLVDRCGCDSTLHCHCFCDDQVVFNNLMLLHEPYCINWDQNVSVPETWEEMQWDEMTGTCPKTGHRVKIWDRNVAFRSGFNHQKHCPHPAKSWIAMPSGLDRSTVYQQWKEACPIDK